MKDIFRFAITLTVVALSAAGSLVWINSITKPKIRLQQENVLTEALAYVLGGSEKGVIEPVQENGEIVYYKGFRDKDKTALIGYAFLVPCQGYSSTIQTLVAIDSSGAILAVKILSQQETPGLGTRCEEILSGESDPWWQRQFVGQNGSEVAVDKDGGPIRAITGATITSRAVTNGIASRTRYLLEKIRCTSDEQRTLQNDIIGGSHGR